MKMDIIYAWCGEKSSAGGNPRRHRDCKELKYSLRSVYKYAPWINHIYILVNTENMTLPSWLNEESKNWITLIDRCKLFDNIEDTPTYNSFAVHTVIHKIPHLTNHFIVMDDDMFFNNPVSPAYFFNQKTMKPIIRTPRECCKIYYTDISNNFPTHKYNIISHRPIPFRIDYIELFNTQYPTYYQFIQSHPYRFQQLSEYLLFIYCEYVYPLDLLHIEPCNHDFLQISHHHENNILPEFQKLFSIMTRTPQILFFNCNDDFSLHPEHFAKQLLILKTFYEKLYPDIPYFEHGHLSTKKIVIAGCGQTIAPYIARIFKNIYMITKLFKEYKIIIFENDSVDDTLKILSHYQKDTNFIILTEKNIPIPSRLHASRISYTRNKLLSKIGHSYADYDYMLMMDMDDVCSSLIAIQHFKNIFKNPCWDAVSFNKLPYDDMWALRYPPFYRNIRNLSNQPPLYKYYVECLKADIVKRLKKKSMIPVLSAFGGFAIYKMPKIKNCWYDAQNRDKSTSRIYYIEDCEHVSFHRQMKERNNAQIFISSSILFPSSPPSQRRNLKSLLFFT